MTITTTMPDAAILFTLRNEDYRWDTQGKLEDLDDGAGVGNVGTEGFDALVGASRVQQEHRQQDREAPQRARRRVAGQASPELQRPLRPNRPCGRSSSTRISSIRIRATQRPTGETG